VKHHFERDGKVQHKEDRRVARTRRALREALLELIQEKGYAAVTVEEITTRANVGRATFYLHYKDKEDLLLEQFSELANERARLLSDIPLSAWRPGATLPVMPLLSIFKHAADNEELYQVVLRGDGHFRIAERMRSIIAVSISEVIEAIVRNEAPDLCLQIPVDYLASYFSGALLGSIAWWLEQNLLKRPSPEEMALSFQNMFIPGMREMVGID
jgi:AcrR family transcriptional regulator